MRRWASRASRRVALASASAGGAERVGPGTRRALAVARGLGAGAAGAVTAGRAPGMLDFDDGLGGGAFGGGTFGGGYGGGLGHGLGGGGGGIGRSSPPPKKVPVSILCGFLGAGKTSMVQHILRNREGLKVGVVVNDVAEANVDSQVLNFEEADGIVGLQNGCACCSGRDDLFARLEELVESSGITKLDKPWDRLVVECSGVAEPESIARELEAMGRRGEPVMKRIFLAGIICVVDASTFRESYNSPDAGDADRLPLSALLVSQLESSDTVIVNKTDLVSPEELAELTQLLAALSPNARRLESMRGALPLRTLLPAEPVDLDMPAYVPSLANRHGVAVRSAEKQQALLARRRELSAAAGASEGTGDGHGHGHGDGHGGHGHDGPVHDGEACDLAGCDGKHGEGGHSHTSSADKPRHDRYGLASFVYRSERKFCPGPLAALARKLPVVAADVAALPGAGDAGPGNVAPAVAFAGVLRSKGFVRVSGGQVAYYWSHAGKRLQVSESPGAPGKGQELVFIGSGMDEGAIVRALDECLEADGAKL